MWPLVVLVALAGGVAASRRRRRPGSLPARAVIVSPQKSTATWADGAVRSVQSAELTLAKDQLDQLWNAPNLENLARTYWLVLSRGTVGLVRVRYREDDRAIVLLARPFTLLRFDAPEYVLERDHGKVTWRIRDGLLVARAGRRCGYLGLDVKRLPVEPGAELAKV